MNVHTFPSPIIRSEANTFLPLMPFRSLKHTKYIKLVGIDLNNVHMRSWRKNHLLIMKLYL